MKRLLSFVICLLILSAVFAGCSRNDESSESTSGNTTSEPTVNTNPGEKVKSWDDLPKTDYSTASGARDFYILGRGGAGVWNTTDLITADQGSTLTAAVVQRTSAVEMRHGINIKVNLFTGNISTTVEALALSDYSDYDLYDIRADEWGKLLLKGHFLDITTLESLNVTDSWWNQRFVNDLTLYGQLYGIIGDATYIDKESTWCVFFNKDVITDYHLDNPYELVESGKWTIEKLKSMAKIFSNDINKDGKMELSGGDCYGIIGEAYNIDILLQACDVKLVAYENNDLIFIDNDKTLLSRAETVFSQIYEMVAESELTYLAQKHSEKWGGGRDFFEKQQALFFIGGINNAQNYLRYFTHDYGILPMPTYNEMQETFYCGVTTFNLPIFCIPTNVKDAEMTATVMQAMACKGKDILMPSYYTTVLKGQVTRDSESWKMLDIIFASMNFDMSTLYTVGGLSNSGKIAWLTVDEKPGQFMSTISENASAAKSHINEIIAYYDKNYKG